ncbi:DUF6093 family protein [Agrococcus sp. DT81.2]|uniref:DUF6093 family protein n=1 Tax=Agrococcus sp. DT81.2 TaxID=3393414 RepID=UPI003CE58AB9
MRVLRNGRRLAEKLMVDRWRCTRGSAPVFDDETGEWTAPAGEVVYDGPGRLRDLDVDSPRAETQGETTIVSALRLWLPWDASAGLRVDDVLECTAAGEDPALVGTKVRITDLHLQTHSTARRFSVEVDSWPTAT